MPSLHHPFALKPPLVPPLHPFRIGVVGAAHLLGGHRVRHGHQRRLCLQKRLLPCHFQQPIPSQVIHPLGGKSHFPLYGHYPTFGNGDLYQGNVSSRGETSGLTLAKVRTSTAQFGFGPSHKRTENARRSSSGGRFCALIPAQQSRCVQRDQAGTGRQTPGTGRDPASLR